MSTSSKGTSYQQHMIGIMICRQFLIPSRNKIFNPSFWRGKRTFSISSSLFDSDNKTKVGHFLHLHSWQCNTSCTWVTGYEKQFSAVEIGMTLGKLSKYLDAFEHWYKLHVTGDQAVNQWKHDFEADRKATCRSHKTRK